MNMKMKMKMIAAACVALTGSGAFAVCSITADTVKSDANAKALVQTCAPDITFYAPGATALKSGIQTVLSANGNVFDTTKNIASIALEGSKDVYGYYGFGATGKSYSGKKVFVLVNGTNGSMAGVKQLITKLKEGSVENVAGTLTDQREYVTLQLLTATQEKAGGTIADAEVAVAFESAKSAFSSAPTLTVVKTRLADFKTAWGKDKQKVAHMAFSDVRPSEATPGQIAKWSNASFPSQTIAMQGFGVLVNNNMYKALMARDVAAKRITDAACDSSDASILLAACQPSVYTPDMTALMTGKITSAAALLDKADADETRVLNLVRRPNSSGTQATAQIRFAGQLGYIGKTPIALGFDMIGADSSTWSVNDNKYVDNVVAVNSGFNVITSPGTGDLIKKVQGDSTNLSIGYASLDNQASSKFGASNGTAATPDLETARWVKVDGISPNFKTDGTVDSKQRLGMKAGYSVAFEFQMMKAAGLAAPYSDIYNDIATALKTADNTGIAYIPEGSAVVDATNKYTAWTRGGTKANISGGNNYFPLNKY